jgi:diaminopimelate epimerase
MSIPENVYKAHGTGNDFVVYADPEGIYEPCANEVMWLADRHRGIGADGLLRITRPEFVSDLSDEQIQAAKNDGATWFMDYRNADGSLAQMCGNGTRVSALFIQGFDKTEGRDQTEQTCLKLGTRAGVKRLTSLGDDEILGHDVFRVDMGKWAIGPLMGHEVRIPGTEGRALGTYVDMGNPHVVCLLDDGSGLFDEAVRHTQSTLPKVESLDLSRKPEVIPALDQGQNVEFVRIESVHPSEGSGRAFMRVHERGVGETLSCGTGLCASAVTLRALTGVSHWTIRVRGGVLQVDVDDDAVYLTGSATIVGKISLSPLR